jgi:hypothetical protein
MTKRNIFKLKIYILLFIIASFMIKCTKVEKGYLSPTMAYSVSSFTATVGRTAYSYTLVPDGSSVPIKVKILHFYDATGKVVDDMFNKTYPVSVWTAAYDSKTDVTYATIMAKRKVVQMAPININESSGQIEANPATIYLPLGSYSIDIQVTNIVGTQVLKNIMTINLVTGNNIDTSPVTGSYSLGRLWANTAGGPANGASFGSFNGINNPFVVETITRVADTPNIISFKLLDKNGKPFNPKNNEIMKRPNSGLNPNPPFLQNLQDYAPDTFVATDSLMTLKYPLVPFPIVSLGNGFNMYYRIPTAFAHIDSTSSWTSNTAGNYYKGTTDTHFKGYFKDNLYDYSLRIPLRINVPGSYRITLKFLNVTHR